ncbi:hypothetical protein EJ110_NYTH55350 [Nymphaea thermarum]|nr:hypothetical protein EJ110_NYTH55350 [Nymphaea thermarum]
MLGKLRLLLWKMKTQGTWMSLGARGVCLPIRAEGVARWTRSYPDEDTTVAMESNPRPSPWDSRSEREEKRTRLGIRSPTPTLVNALADAARLLLAPSALVFNLLWGRSVTAVPTHALVDKGATHNFVASHLVEHFGLVAKPNASHVKAINAIPSTTDGKWKLSGRKLGHGWTRYLECKEWRTVDVVNKVKPRTSPPSVRKSARLDMAEISPYVKVEEDGPEPRAAPPSTPSSGVASQLLRDQGEGTAAYPRIPWFGYVAYLLHQWLPAAINGWKTSNALMAW